jgi:hypothetical protein
MPEMVWYVDAAVELRRKGTRAVETWAAVWKPEGFEEG